jgi:hypothetical protein
MENCDFSIVNARNKGDAIEMLDEWGRESHREACDCDSHEGIPDEPRADGRQPSGPTSL